MAEDIRTHSCYECWSEMRFEERDDTIECKGETRTLKTLGWWCIGCGEAIFEGDALKVRERAFQELKAAADQVLGPSASGAGLPYFIALLNQTHLENRNFVAGDPEDLTPARSGAFTRSPPHRWGGGAVKGRNSEG